MAVIKVDDILGIFTDGHHHLYCVEHFQGNLGEVALEDILTEKDVERNAGEIFYFCDDGNHAI